MFENNSLLVIGAVVCIGGVALLALLAYGLRSMFAARPPQQMDRDDDRIWNQPGQERPRYDDEEIESRGGFGNAPGASRQEGGGLGSRPATPRQTRGGLGGRAGPTGRRGDRPLHDRRTDRDQDDDDDVRSRGGFGK